MNCANQIRTAIANAPVMTRDELATRFNLDDPNVVAARSVPQFGLLLRTLVALGTTEGFDIPDAHSYLSHETEHRHASEVVGGVLVGLGVRTVFLEDDAQDFPRFQFFHRATYPNGISPFERAVVALYPSYLSLSDVRIGEDCGFSVQEVADKAYLNNAEGKPYIPAPLSVSPSLTLVS